MNTLKKRLALAGSALALLLSGCAPTTQVAAPLAAPARPAAGAVVNGRVQADPALWMVKDADTTIYLFGTVHVLRSNIDWFDDNVKRAYDESGELVLEVVQPDVATSQAKIVAIATDPDGPPLTTKLGPALAAKYRAAMATAEVPAAAFEAFEPWFVASALGVIPLQKLGYTPDSGAEAVLTKAAKASGKPIGQLETFEQQLGFFDTLPEPLQIKFLASTIDEIPTVETKFGQLIDSWVRGDADRLAVLMNEGMRETPEIAKLLLADRNARWSQWIDDRLDRPGAVFVAVGAGHLAGSDSVQAMLAKRGFKVTRVRS